jgi:hypothetical protein
VVRHLGEEGVETGEAKEAAIRQWAVAYREHGHLGLFPPGVPPELLREARELARLLAAIDLGIEQGDTAMLDALGGRDNPSFGYLRADVARRERASRGGQTRSGRYSRCEDEWRGDWENIASTSSRLSKTRISELVAELHRKRYETSDAEEQVKTVSARTIRDHLFPREK